MCRGPGEQASVSGALAMLDRALDALNSADAASLPADVQAQALRGLGRAEAKHVAARARMLAAFTTGGGYESDGQGSARTWLRWQTRLTNSAAAVAVAWAKRLAAHPVIAEALAAGDLSPSWARELCGWSDLLPPVRRGDADQILVAAALGGADLADLAGLARQMYERAREDEPDSGDDGFDDRFLRLGITFRGAGRAEGDLTPGCAAALAAVLDALGKKAGPEDVRSIGQRHHDALEEACRRLIASGMLPARAGQPTQIQVHMTLSQLRDIPGASRAEQAWATERATQSGWLAGPDADAAACDATLVPVVTGQVDFSALDRLTHAYLAALQVPAQGPTACGCTCGGCSCHSRLPAPSKAPPSSQERPSPEIPVSPQELPSAEIPVSPQALDLLRGSLLRMAADTLSGPGGLAARLRAGLGSAPLTSVSLPLDVGTATEAIPGHLRRAVMARHTHCMFPGCRQPATVCGIHHIVPRSRGGSTALDNMVPVCTFHHLVAIHRWGWYLTLNPDGTTTATGPGGRVHRSHGPPSEVA